MKLLELQTRNRASFRGLKFPKNRIVARKTVRKVNHTLRDLALLLCRNVEVSYIREQRQLGALSNI